MIKLPKLENNYNLKNISPLGSFTHETKLLISTWRHIKGTGNPPSFDFKNANLNMIYLKVNLRRMTYLELLLRTVYNKTLEHRLESHVVKSIQPLWISQTRLDATSSWCVGQLMHESAVMSSLSWAPKSSQRSELTLT